MFIMVKLIFASLIYSNIIAVGGIYQVENTQAELQSSNELPTSFPKIRGPKSLNSTIAIIGAGPSGVHMAYRLKVAGYKHVTVFEKDPQVGGKSFTYYHRNIPHEMGTVYTQPDYTAIYDLIKEFNAGEILPMPSPTVWIKTNNTLAHMRNMENALRVLEQLRPDLTNISERIDFITNAIRKYVYIHKKLFGDYIGELMPRPHRNVLAQLNMTFLQFLKNHNIEILKVPFLAAMTAQGYGHVDEISALYGMIWMTPRFLTKIAKPAPPEERSYVKILSKGFQFLWEEMCRKANLNIKLSSPVQYITRLYKGFSVKYKRHGNYYCKYFDFLIISPSMKDMSSAVIKFYPEENSVFQRTFNYFYTTTLAHTTFTRKRGPTPQNYYTFNMERKIENSVWVQRESNASLNYIVGENYTSGKFIGAPDKDFIQSSVYYQFSKRQPKGNCLRQELRKHINSIEQADLRRISKQIIWPYFPRYSVSDMAQGVLWDIFDMQGKYGIWYIGSSVSFESVKSVIEYNNLILRHFL